MGIFGNFWKFSEKHRVDLEKRRKNRSVLGKIGSLRFSMLDARFLKNLVCRLLLVSAGYLPKLTLLRSSSYGGRAFFTTKDTKKHEVLEPRINTDDTDFLNFLTENVIRTGLLINFRSGLSAPLCV
jgi:hypothetical protein